MLVIWVVTLPVIVLIILIKERKNLGKLYMKRYFLILYQGLKPQAFYWEFVNTLRKIIIPLFNVMLSRSSSFYQVMVAIIILILLFRLQQYIKPYKLEENNQIEILAVLTGTVTLFGALVFLDSVQETDTKNVEFLEIFSLMLIFLVNVYFILRWIHIFLYAFKSKNSALIVARRILGWALMKHEDQETLRRIEKDQNASALQPKKKKNKSKHKSSHKKKLKKRRRKQRAHQNLRHESKEQAYEEEKDQIYEEEKELDSKRELLDDIENKGGYSTLFKLSKFRPADFENHRRASPDVYQEFMHRKMSKPVKKFTNEILDPRDKFTIENFPIALHKAFPIGNQTDPEKQKSSSQTSIVSEDNESVSSPVQNKKNQKRSFLSMITENKDK